MGVACTHTFLIVGTLCACVLILWDVLLVMYQGGLGGSLSSWAVSDFLGVGTREVIERMEEAKKTFTIQEVSQHTAQDDCWMVIDGKVGDSKARYHSLTLMESKSGLLAYRLV